MSKTIIKDMKYHGVLRHFRDISASSHGSGILNYGGHFITSDDGLVRNSQTQGFLYNDNAGLLFNLSHGYLKMVVKFPRGFTNGVYEGLTGDFLLWGVNIDSDGVASPGIISVLSNDGIEFGISSSAGEHYIVNDNFNINANEWIEFEYYWNSDNIPMFTSDDYLATMALVINGDIVLGNSPIVHNTLAGKKFQLFDPHQSLECVVRELLISMDDFSEVVVEPEESSEEEPEEPVEPEELFSNAWSWGNNSQRQLGYKEDSFGTVHQSTPIRVWGGNNFIKIWAGYFHSLAIDENDKLWSWGGNNEGQLGDNSTTQRSSPIEVAGDHVFVESFGGLWHTLALKENGELWAWGSGFRGTLGNNSTDSQSSPVSIYGSHSFVEISGRDHSLALKSNGEVWAWGNNEQGQLGDNSTDHRSTPVKVYGSHSFVKIAGNSRALKANGEVWAWGNNDSGQLGNNKGSPGEQESTPVNIHGSHSFIQIAAGEAHTLALKSNGEVWTWGRNNNGRLGDNSTDNQSTPVKIHGSHSFIQIAAGDRHSLALKANGEIWSWGGNRFGKLGNNSSINDVFDGESTPVQVYGGHSFITIDGGGLHSLAI